jgi:hypothetical protein
VRLERVVACVGCVGISQFGINGGHVLCAEVSWSRLLLLKRCSTCFPISIGFSSSTFIAHYVICT